MHRLRHNIVKTSVRRAQIKRGRERERERARGRTGKLLDENRLDGLIEDK
jgi:hypothetical protein